jgi:hypothetical protein
VFAQKVTLGAFIDALPETDTKTTPSPLTDAHFKRLARLLGHALEAKRAGDAERADQALVGALRVLANQGRTPRDFVLALGAEERAKRRSIRK